MLLLVLVAGGCALGTARLNAQEAAAGVVDFQTDVLPILRQHCFECHAGSDVKGDLRLDSRDGMVRGGHSGNSVLAASAEGSELFLRIVSDSDGYRMPKSGPSLNQDEVLAIKNWIDQGANWPILATPIPKVDNDTSLTQWLGERWNEAGSALEQPRWRYTTWLLGVAATIGLVYAVASKFETQEQRRQRIEQGSGAHSRPVDWKTRLFVLTLVGLAAYTAFLQGRVEEFASGSNDSSHVDSPKRKADAEELIVSLDHLPTPPYPMHPSRLGGTYYRGNDERSPQLFNGGFYRTATMDLFLVDSTGTRLQRGDQVDGELFVELTISRAPQATRELFKERVRKITYVNHFSELPQKSESGRIELQVVAPENQWRCQVPIANVASVMAGKIYVYYGAQQYEGQQGRVHFGISYNLTIDDGKIANGSELWMGSLYNLKGRVLVPGRDQLLLDRWFDFRPIPVIQGQGSQDPKLLGTDEHQPSSVSDSTQNLPEPK